MKLLALLSMGALLLPTYSFAQMPWAYCDGEKSPNADDPQTSDPSNAWICSFKAPSASSAPEANQTRCTNMQAVFCKAGAGGAGNVGPHNIPRNGWYAQGSAVPGDGMIRCQCGCFVGEVELLTTRGNLRFEDAARTATKSPFRVAIPRTDGKLFASEVMANKSFTVGPEVKDIIKFTTDMGLEIDLTDQHPVLVSTDEGYEMVQARFIKVGDKLLTKEGLETSVALIKTYKLPVENNKVYNVDTLGKTAADHVIVANSLQMGDVKWQNHLSEISQREQMLKKNINAQN